VAGERSFSVVVRGVYDVGGAGSLYAGNKLAVQTLRIEKT
jgi:hypothetical protein